MLVSQLTRSASFEFLNDTCLKLIYRSLRSMVTVTQKFTVRVASILARLSQDKFQPIQLLDANSIGADGEYEADFHTDESAKVSRSWDAFCNACSSLHICFSHLAFRLDSQRTWSSRRPLSVAFYWPIYSRWENTHTHTHENAHENANISKSQNVFWSVPGPAVGRGTWTLKHELPPFPSRFWIAFKTKKLM